MKICVAKWENVGKENTFVAVNCRRVPTNKRPTRLHQAEIIF
jgi:hypothetical protein